MTDPLVIAIVVALNPEPYACWQLVLILNLCRYKKCPFRAIFVYAAGLGFEPR